MVSWFGGHSHDVKEETGGCSLPVYDEQRPLLDLSIYDYSLDLFCAEEDLVFTLR
jgi:hypothetical protein